MQAYDLWENRNKQSESCDCTSLLPGGRFQDAVQGQENKQSSVVSLCWGDWHQRSRRAKWLESVGQRTRQKGAAQRESERERQSERSMHSAVLSPDRPPWSLWLSTDLHMHERKLRKTEGVGRTIPRVHTGLGVVCVHVSQSRKAL